MSNVELRNSLRSIVFMFSYFLNPLADLISRKFSDIADHHSFDIRHSTFDIYRASMARIMSPAFSEWSAMEPMVSASRIM